MANNYTLFSSSLSFPSGKKDHVQAIVDSFVENEDDDCSSISSLGIEIENEEITIYSEESGDVDTAVALAQKILDELTIDEPFALEWAVTCSKPRPGEFGGGAVIVRRGKAPVYMDTGTWVAKELAETKP